MKKLVLSALVLVAAGGISYLVWFSDSADDSGSGAAGRDADAEVVVDGDPAELAAADEREPAPAQPASEPKAAAAPRTAEAQSAEAERREARETVRLEGRVVLPASLPADEVVHVRAFDEEPAWWEMRPETEHDQEDGLPLVAVEPDGSFSLEVPEDWSQAWLSVEGRYLFMTEASPVELNEDAAPELEPELGAWITGRLVPPTDATEAELEDAGSMVQWRPNPLGWSMRGDEGRFGPRTTKADPGNDFAFELAGVMPGAAGRVRAFPTHLAAAKSESFDVEPGSHLVVDLPLSRGGRLAGRVVGEDGEPVPDADLDVQQDPLMFGQGGVEVRTTDSGDDGAFVLEAIATGKASIEVEADGYLTEMVQIDLKEGDRIGDFEIVLGRGNVLNGRVVWPDGTPAVGADVDVEFDVSYMGGMEAMNAMRGAEGGGETDDEGRFRVSGLGNGPFTVKAEAEREDAAEGETEWLARLDGVRPDSKELVLLLEPPIGIKGRVLNDLGEPVTEFEVIARTATKGMIRGLGSERSDDHFEDEEGRFFLSGMRSGNWEVFARAEGYGLAEPLAIEMPLADDAEVLLYLDRAATVRGVVVDPRGLPVEGAEVGLRVTLNDIGRFASSDGDRPATESDENGTFTLTGLSAGTVELVANAEDFATSEPVTVELGAGEMLADLVFELRVGGRIEGLVLDAEGEPAKGETVLVQNPTDVIGQRFVTTDSDGEFVVEGLSSGQYQVMTFPKSDAALGGGDVQDFTSMFSDMKFDFVEVVDGETAYVTLGEKLKDPVSIHGRVVSNDEPVPGVMITFYSDAKVEEGGGGFDALKFVSTNSEGVFTTQLAKPGRYMVNVQKLTGTGQQQSIEYRETVPEGETHEMVLELPSAKIAGRVLGPDGEPLESTRVTLAVDGPIGNGSFTGGQYAEIWTEEDGTYELVWLRPGTYTVAAGGSFLGGLFGDLGSKTYGRHAKSGIRIGAGQVLDGVDFRLEEPGSITGKVVDVTGAPVSEAALFLRDPDGNVLDRFSMVLTDAAGNFTYSSLEEGTYEITARTRDQVSSEPQDVQVRSGEETETTVTLNEGTILLVIFVGADEEPLSCDLTVTDGRGNQVNGLWSFSDLMTAFAEGGISSEEQRVGPLPPGTYKLEATTDDGRRAKKSVNLSGQEVRKIRLRLD